MIKQKNKKILIGLGLTTATVVLPISIVACATNETNAQKITKALDLITETSFKIENKSNKMATSITEANLQTEVVLNITGPTTSGVKFTYTLATEESKKPNDTTGTINLIVTGTIGTDKNTKEIKISGFLTTVQAADKATAQAAVDAITSLTEADNSPKGTTLASKVTPETLKTFVQNPANSANGVVFAVTIISTNDTTGILTLGLTGTLNGQVATRETTTPLTISGFLTTDQNNFAIAQAAVDAINTLTEATNSPKGTTLASEVKPETLKTFVQNPANSANGVVFAVTIISTNDTTGILTLGLTGTLNGQVATRETTTPLTISGFKTTDQRAKDLVVLQNTYNEIVQNSLIINNSNAISEILASSATNEFINQNVKINPINNVNFTLEVDSPNDTAGTLNVKVIASFEGQILKTKILNVDNFKTATMAFGDWLGLSNSEVNTTFFTPSVTNILTQNNIDTMRSFIKQIGIINKNQDFGTTNASRFTLANYQITDLNGDVTTFTKDSTDMKITINGTLDENAVSFSKELKGFTAISTILDKLFTFERSSRSLITSSRGAGRNFTDLISTSIQGPNSGAFGVIVKPTDFWAKDIEGNVLFNDNNIPRFKKDLEDRNLRLAFNGIASFRWSIINPKFVGTGTDRVLQNPFSINLPFDSTISGGNPVIPGNIGGDNINTFRTTPVSLEQSMPV
ncbi:lipoprotein 17-related variable surface protein [[Mycoplasma] mobile]|uniref:Variable surface protein mvspK n=1 Tax=Mycoplasma mobile (strain ATCC 43663 / 163K / NCTC 11711) TaxID=267748 RepID=Q6KHV4_MYCM1|nr:lipoprotein 17-related variable surface protein [[Mycoplasma] mobile]AAT27823.1 variable surface protein mvspK [Mycoplasma mobile 163K]